jgi:broad specificity phosphatase PhoE
LQTAAELADALGLPAGAWTVDWALSEICDPRVLLQGRPDCEHAAKGRPLDAWMWAGYTAEEALAMFKEDCALFFFGSDRGGIAAACYAFFLRVVFVPAHRYTPTHPTPNKQTQKLPQKTGARELPTLAAAPTLEPGSTPPAFPETLAEGLKRYGRALQAAAFRHPGKNVLVVTHGEVGARCAAFFCVVVVLLYALRLNICLGHPIVFTPRL